MRCCQTLLGAEGESLSLRTLGNPTGQQLHPTGPTVCLGSEAVNKTFLFSENTKQLLSSTLGRRQQPPLHSLSSAALGSLQT